MDKQQTINDYLIDKARANLTTWMIHEARNLQRILGFGYVESDSAPNDFASLKAAYQHSLRTGMALPVYDGGCGSTIYTSAEGNWAFRFVHDVTHVQLDAGFSTADETRVVMQQAKRVRSAFGKESLEYRMFMADALGQVTYYAIHGKFVEDQLAFVKAQLQAF